MFGSIFRPYGLVWNICNTITDVLGLSLLWCLCSLPLVTAAAATTALYDAAVHGIRYHHSGTYHRFFRTLRRELKTSLPVAVLWGAVLLLAGFILSVLTAEGMSLLAGVYCFLMLLPLSAACWSAAILSRFTYGFGGLTATALRFLPAHPIASLVLGLSTWGAVWLCQAYYLPLAFLPAVTVLVWSLAAERVFQRYGAGLEPTDIED